MLPSWTQNDELDINLENQMQVAKEDDQHPHRANKKKTKPDQQDVSVSVGTPQPPYFEIEWACDT